MALRIGIASFYAESQGAQNGYGRFELVGELFELEQRFHAGKEFFGKDRFIQEIVSASFNAAEFVLAVTQAGDEHHGNQAGGRIVLDLAADLIPRLSGHNDIEQNQVRW